MGVIRSKKVLENYVCPECWHQVQDCTCKYFPPWSLIMIDVGIQEIIRILNEKGWRTTGCCESHFTGNTNIHVCFIMDYNIGCPDGFNLAKRKTCIVYQFKKNELQTRERYEAVKAEKIKALLEWAKSIPENQHIYS